ncbi:MAG: hypothetical protein ABFD60_14475 [Bryobacteraceae bacterium]
MKDLELRFDARSLLQCIAARSRTDKRLLRIKSNWAGVAVLPAVAVVDFPFHHPAEWTLRWVFVAMFA